MIKKSMAFSITLIIAMVTISQNAPSMVINEQDSVIKSSVMADWTIMLYIDGDNNLEDGLINIFEEISGVGSSENLNIVAQFDRIEGYTNRYGDWSECKRFYLAKGVSPDENDAIMNIGEVNMGDPDTLVDFVDWSVKNYVANKYCLVLFNHGLGWKGVCSDETSNKNDLSMPELRTAFRNIENNILHKNLDLLVFNACLMGMQEVYHEIKDHVDISIASEEITALDVDTDYKTIFQEIKENTYYNAEKFAEIIVNNFHTYFGVKLNNIGEISISITDLVKALEDSNLLSKSSLTQLARTNSELYKNGLFPFQRDVIDLYDFAEYIKNSPISNENVKSKASALMTTIRETVIGEPQYGDSRSNVMLNGISIYFPYKRENYNEDKAEYKKLSFTQETDWNNLLDRNIKIGRNVRYSYNLLLHNIVQKIINAVFTVQFCR
jgi:hypothetical protein